jgi:hypothetical protein
MAKLVRPHGRRTAAVGDALVWALDESPRKLMAAGDAIDGGSGEPR